MRLICALALATAALAAIGCDNQPTTVSGGFLRALAASGVLNVKNYSVRPINYFIVDRNSLALINWGQCAGPTCPSLRAGGSLAMPYDSIAFYTAQSKEAVVYWWHSMFDGKGGYKPDGLWHVIVPLH